jgi:hypothetical protein
MDTPPDSWAGDRGFVEIPSAGMQLFTLQSVHFWRSAVRCRGYREGISVAKFLLWLLLLCICWPLALLALVAYPIVWLLLLPFRLLGIAVEGVFSLLRALIFFPARILSGPSPRL